MIMNAENILAELNTFSNKNNLEGMKRFGINPDKALGISVKNLREIAKRTNKDHTLALELWKTEIHEARILATMIDNQKEVTKSQMNSWVKDFNSWDICDQTCNNLFRKTPYAVEYSYKWVESKHEFIRRAGFVLMACLSVHNKQMKDEDFIKYFPLIIKHSVDERNFVKKAVNWALRQIGKRNINLNSESIGICNHLIKSDFKSANWIGQDALRELTSEKIIRRFT